MRLNYRTVSLEFSGAPSHFMLPSWQRHWSEVAPRLMSCDLQSDSTFFSWVVCFQKSMQGSICTLFLFWALLKIFPALALTVQEGESWLEGDLCRAIYSSSLTARPHAGFRCALCEFCPCLRTYQECYLLSVEILVAVIGRGDRLQFLRCRSRQEEIWSRLCSQHPLHGGDWFHFS